MNGERRLGALASAASLFRELLVSPPGRQARTYLDGRGIGAGPECDAYLLGYAPERPVLLERLRSEGFLPDDVVDAGLAKRRDDGKLVVRFRNRIAFPVRDLDGAVVGFSCRALDDERRPKYLNGPETPLFRKRSLLYGLFELLAATGRPDVAVIVEGQMDVLALRRVGCGAVSPLGTAFSGPHARILARYFRDVVFLFDADEAGEAAARRALLEVAWAGRRLFTSLRVATLDEGSDDPAAVVLAKGPRPIEVALREARDFAGVFSSTREGFGDACAVALALGDADEAAELVADAHGVSVEVARRGMRKIAASA